MRNLQIISEQGGNAPKDVGPFVGYIVKTGKNYYDDDKSMPTKLLIKEVLSRTIDKQKPVDISDFSVATYGIQAVRPTIGEPYVASAGYSNNQRMYLSVNESERLFLNNTTDIDSKFCWTIDAQTTIPNNTKLNLPIGENTTYDIPNHGGLEVVAPIGAKFICIQSKKDGSVCMPEVFRYVSRIVSNEEAEKELTTKVNGLDDKLSTEKSERIEADKLLKKDIFKEIGEIKNKIIPIPTKKYNYLLTDRKNWAGFSSFQHVYLPVEQGKSYVIKGNTDYDSNYAWAIDITTSINGQKANGLSVEDNNVYVIEKGSVVSVVPPSDAKYMVVNVSNGTSYDNTWSIAPIVEEKLTLVEALNIGDNALDIVSLNGENEINNKLLQLKRHLNMNISGASGLMPVVLLWFSDIHSDKVQFKRIMQFYEKYKTSMDGVLCTGDMVFDSLKDDYSYLNDDIKKMMITIGNHDSAKTAWNDLTVTAEEDYNIFIKPFVDAGLVDNSTVNKCYWYKDYKSQKLRLIGLDALHWDADQKSWLESALNDAKGKGLSVICANHYFAGNDRTHIDCAFDTVQKLSEGSAFINSEAPAAVQKFIDNGGDFVCWLGGHTHRDYVYYLTNYPKQLGFNIDCATCSNGVTDEERENGTKSQDSFNLMAFDTTRKLIKIARIGSDRDSLLRKKDTLCINYHTKQVYTELNPLDKVVNELDKRCTEETTNWKTRTFITKVEEGKTTLWNSEMWIKNNDVFQLNNNGQSIPINVEDTKLFKIKNLSDSEVLSFHMLKSYSGATHGSKPDFYSEEKIEIKPFEEREFTKPSEVKYLFVRFRNLYNKPFINFEFSWLDKSPKVLINEEVKKNKVKKVTNLSDLVVSGGAEAGQEVNSTKWVGTQDFLSHKDYDAFEYNMFAQSNCGINFYDKNKKFCAFHQISKGNGELKHVTIEFPIGAEYAKVTAKGRVQGDYLYGIKYEEYTAQKLFDKIQAVESAASNGGYVYLAGNYGISVDNPDNGPALTALFEKVSQSGGGIIELPKGTFIFKSTVKFMSNVHLRGQGIGNTILDMQDGIKNNYSLFEGDFVYNIGVSDLEVQSPKTTKTGKHFFMRYIKDAHFTRIKSVGSRPTALGIDFLNRVSITDNIIIDAGRGGNIFGHSCIGIGTGYDEWDAEDIVIANNICVGGGMRGIFVEDQKRFTLARDGKMKSGKGQVITGNVVRKCNRGITVETGRYVNVSNNTIYDCNEGLAVHIWADDCLFASNLLVGNKVGISVAELEHVSSDNISFIGNSIHKSITAINIDTKGLMNNIAIKDNVFRDCENGVNIQGDTNRLVIQSNNDFSTKKSFVLSGNITDPIIKDNTFFIAPENTATLKGVTTFVEQMN